MPHIIQGGRLIFGLSEVREDFRIRLPLEAYYEYRFHEGKTFVLISGSEAAGGFSLHAIDTLRHSRLSILLETLKYNHAEDRFLVEERSVNAYKNRLISWVFLDEQAIFTIGAILAGALGIKAKDKLVVTKGNNNGPVFLQKGEVYDSAHTHPDLEVF